MADFRIFYWGDVDDYMAQGPILAWVLALTQISQPQASICFVVARSLLRGSLEELAAAQSGEKPKYLKKENLRVLTRTVRLQFKRRDE